jgi:hypothetical protein
MRVAARLRRDFVARLAKDWASLNDFFAGILRT